MATSNVWILKPAGKSRGRGIQLFNTEEKLLEVVGEWEWVSGDKFLVACWSALKCSAVKYRD
jgi:hypothetical protein